MVKTVTAKIIIIMSKSSVLLLLFMLFLILTADRFASDSRVEVFRVHVRTTAGPTAEVGSGVVAATSSFAHARTARDSHLTPALP